MKSHFSRTLSALRRETGHSQRQTAADLGISQALLSHYENGAREPKLEFVVKACGYYDVTADYILGRTDQRKGQMLPFPHGCDGAAQLISAACAAFDMLEMISDPDLYAAAVNYLVIPAENMTVMLREPDAPNNPMRDADLKLAEAALVTNARRAVNAGTPKDSGKPM